MQAFAACTVASNVSVMMYRSTVLCRRSPGSDGGADNYSSGTRCTRFVPAVHLVFYRGGGAKALKALLLTYLLTYCQSTKNNAKKTTEYAVDFNRICQ